MQSRLMDDEGNCAQIYTEEQLVKRAHFSKLLHGHERALAEVLDEERQSLVPRAQSNAGVHRQLD